MVQRAASTAVLRLVIAAALHAQTVAITHVEVIDTAGGAARHDAGRMADMALLDGNPLSDIRNTRRIAAVFAGGAKIRT